MLRLRAVSEVGAQVSGATRVPQASPLAGRGTSPLRAGARPHWDHPASREHTCHRAEPSPPRTPAPQSRPQRRAPRRRLYSGGRTKTTQTPLNAKEKGGGSTFPRKQPPHPASEQPRGCPAPPLTSPCPPGARPQRRRPAQPPGRALTSWGPASVAPPVWRWSVGPPPPPPLPPPQLQPPPKRCPARRRGWRRAAVGSPEVRGRGAAGPSSGKSSARGAERAGSEPPAPGKSQLCRPGGRGLRAEGSESRARAPGGERLRSGRDWHLGGPRGRGSGRRGAGGEEVCTAREVRGG